MKVNQVYHNKFNAMGTQLDVVIPNIPIDEGEELFYKMLNRVKFVESVFNRFDDSSELSIFNNLKAGIEFKPSELFFKVVVYCKKHFELTYGLFDISVKPLLDYWDIRKGKVHRTDFDEKEFVNFRNLSGFKVRIVDGKFIKNCDNEGFDFGAYLKGMVLEELRIVLLSEGVKSAFLHFGGSSILAIGNYPGNDGWGFSLPFFNNKKVLLFNSSISISGSNYKDQYSHIIDPKSQFPIKVKSYTAAYGKDASVCEVLSTITQFASNELRNKVLLNYKNYTTLV